jgi:carbon monoxide dehydrogenase subunit G
VRALVAAVVGVALAATGLAPARADAGSTVKIWRGAASDTSEGEVWLAVDADAAYAALTDVARWPAIFPRVRSVAVVTASPTAPVVELVSRKGKRRTLRFANEPRTRTVRFTERTQADVTATIVFIPASGGRTRVRATLSADVGGLAGLFVRERTIRAKRESRLAGYLDDLERHFGAAAPP